MGASKKIVFLGAPGAIRTPDPLVRSQILYPTELRVRICTFNLIALANQESAIIQAQPRFVKHNLTQSQQ